MLWKSRRGNCWHPAVSAAQRPVKFSAFTICRSLLPTAPISSWQCPVRRIAATDVKQEPGTEDNSDPQSLHRLNRRLLARLAHCAGGGRRGLRSHPPRLLKERTEVGGISQDQSQSPRSCARHRQGIITENPAILLYIAQTHPKAELAPLDDPFALGQIQAFNSFLCSTVHPAHAHRMRGYRWSDDTAVVEAMKVKVPQNMRIFWPYRK